MKRYPILTSLFITSRLQWVRWTSVANGLIVTLGLGLLSACQMPLMPMANAATNGVEPGTLVAPVVERRETITATGYAVVSVQMSRNAAQQRLLAIRAAKLDAYRSLTEQVYGLRVDASASVADMVVQNDTFRSRVEGVIFGANLASITPTGDDTYEVTLHLDRSAVNDLRTLYLTHLTARTK